MYFNTEIYQIHKLIILNNRLVIGSIKYMLHNLHTQW